MAKKDKINWDKFITPGEEFFDFWLVENPKKLKGKTKTGTKKKNNNDGPAAKPKK